MCDVCCSNIVKLCDTTKHILPLPMECGGYWAPAYTTCSILKSIDHPLQPCIADFNNHLALSLAHLCERADRNKNKSFTVVLFSGATCNAWVLIHPSMSECCHRVSPLCLYHFFSNSSSHSPREDRFVEKHLSKQDCGPWMIDLNAAINCGLSREHSAVSEDTLP